MNVSRQMLCETSTGKVRVCLNQSMVIILLLSVWSPIRPSPWMIGKVFFYSSILIFVKTISRFWFYTAVVNHHYPNAYKCSRVEQQEHVGTRNNKTMWEHRTTSPRGYIREIARDTEQHLVQPKYACNKAMRGIYFISHGSVANGSIWRKPKIYRTQK